MIVFGLQGQREEERDYSKEEDKSEEDKREGIRFLPKKIKK